MTVITPERSPRVLDEPVLLAVSEVSLAVADDSHGVVHIRLLGVTAITVFVVDDTT